ncbi:hypothetical protein A2331_05605 [Candidatus Falkowbacteria bacterium RIFOXYB2_FULL_34_18]|uniref:DDH domain-containing protein n=1 Tax=Candidatus Falkowbacteria bacterium RIFOXYD2_FULL_34_120 TaxID=1798007 RepID=A0A1F5TQY1_9BACT|nr:MAG: hypothetical protein A2331_05605 [Candidatus Falkowbacteria bacterium RIFOXYB2_FULL_34_18]OGF29816.1 MAG: hypothetical protein A2500_01425 [Candidatus Falkowbacteria bacterium RIFOXYC12_FULL_34_55]OGF37069.1 MAG: hypothetical protein A2466_05780 [Candidatus Falkowbacteria bacterium RIFOXYC2_FULL_34_220]OGF39261.1 MAG: hypothetical protein A2515_00990 [Candidatus Falkowbacteria bacterium RIFOXYD12_FULL_34_57]OGF41366.1 MAG: hypothetical protein A2531_07200 [Candidatus Falkowbacteria bact
MKLISEMINKFKQAFSAMQNAKNILLVTHNKPDGDALSSICAFIELFSVMEKKFTAYCYDEPYPQFGFLPHLEKIVSNREKINFSEFDCIISLDCGAPSRTMLKEELINRNKNQIAIEFDHHPKIEDYADIEIRIPESSSTAEIIYKFLTVNKIRFNKNFANCILTGILTDTGNFLYPSTTNETIEIASKMLVYGARFPVITENTYKNKTLSGMKIWGKAINNLKINKKYNFAYSVLTLNDLSESGATVDELEGISGLLSNLHGVNALMLLREEFPGKIKGSLRTANNNIDVSKLAIRLGGGGHPRASGFAFDGHIEETNNGWRII